MTTLTIKYFFKSNIELFFDNIEDTKKIKINSSIQIKKMIEPLLLGIVLGLIPVTLIGLFFAAYRQYKRSSEIGLE